MTAIQVIEMNRAAHKRMCRRHVMYGRMASFLCHVVLFLALMWCYTSRQELARVIYRACYTFVMNAHA